jgi:hypothetical protein
MFGQPQRASTVTAGNTLTLATKADLGSAPRTSQPRAEEGIALRTLVARFRGIPDQPTRMIYPEAVPEQRGDEHSSRAAVRRPPGGIVSLSSPESKLVYRLPKPAPDGRTELVLSPLQHLERLVRFIPAPRVHRHRYHGVLAPNARAWVALAATEVRHKPHAQAPECPMPAGRLEERADGPDLLSAAK